LSVKPKPADPNVEMIQVPNTLRQRVGGGFTGIDAKALARAEAALKDLSGQFGQWLQDEVAKLEEAQAAIKARGLTQETIDNLFVRAHDLKGLGATYEFPLVTRIAGSLCRLLDNQAARTGAPMYLVDAHVGAIRAAVRDNIRDTNNPVGLAIATELERVVAERLQK
jgi:hypothetical protein